MTTTQQMINLAHKGLQLIENLEAQAKAEEDERADS